MPLKVKAKEQMQKIGTYSGENGGQGSGDNGGGGNTDPSGGNMD